MRKFQLSEQFIQQGVASKQYKSKNVTEYRNEQLQIPTTMKHLLAFLIVVSIQVIYILSNEETEVFHPGFYDKRRGWGKRSLKVYWKQNILI